MSGGMLGAMFGSGCGMGCSSCSGCSMSSAMFGDATAADYTYDFETGIATPTDGSDRGPLVREVPKAPGTSPDNPIVLPGITLVGHKPQAPTAPIGPVYDTPFGPEGPPAGYQASSGGSGAAMAIGAAALAGVLILKKKRRKSGRK